MINDNIKSEVLQDGVKNKWKSKKKNSLELSNSFSRIGIDNVASRVYDCSTYLEYKRFKDDTLKLNKANFCKVRLCPMCAWRRSLKLFGQVSKVMDYAEEHKKYKYLFLTLTIRNCEGQNLSETLDSLFTGFKRLQQRKWFKNTIRGYFRALEVTYSYSRKDYHPHFHVILAVDPIYFKKHYISQDRWATEWQKCMRLDYKPTTDIRTCKPRRKDQNIKSAVAEVAKYTVKDSDYLIKDEYGNILESWTDEIVETLYYALSNRRLTTFGGEFREIHRELQLDDAVDGDLVNTDNDEIREDLDYIIERYNWGYGASGYNYYKA